MPQIGRWRLVEGAIAPKIQSGGHRKLQKLPVWLVGAFANYKSFPTGLLGLLQITKAPRLACWAFCKVRKLPVWIVGVFAKCESSPSGLLGFLQLRMIFQHFRELFYILICYLCRINQVSIINLKPLLLCHFLK
jgi:hypothetical protein